MQRTPSAVTLTLAAAAFAYALTTPAQAQGKPYWVGEGTSLREAAERFDRSLGPLALKERNGGLIDLGDFVHLDKIVFPAGVGEGIQGAGLQETGGCGGGIADEARRRLRERVIELADQPVPVRYEDLHELKVVILDAQVDAALADLARAIGAEGPPQILDAGAAVDAIARRVRFEVDPTDPRQAGDAEELIAEFVKTLEGDVLHMRGKKSAGLQETGLLLAEFRMNVERTRARRAVEVGASPAPAMIHFASLFRQRERLAKGVGTAN